MEAVEYTNDQLVCAHRVTAEHYADSGNVQRYIEFVERNGNIGTLVDWGRTQGVSFEGVIVEAGCGPGLHLAFLESVGAREIVAVDLSPAMVEEARRRSGQLSVSSEAVVADITEEIPVSDGGADVVFSNAVLLHLGPTQFAAAQSEFYRVLKDGGRQVSRLLLDPEGSERAEGQIGRPEIHHSGRYFHLYTADEIQGMLEGVGFEPGVTIERDSDLGGNWGRFITRKPLSVAP